MRKWILGCLAIMCLGAKASAQDTSAYETKVNSYIAQYKEMAIAEQKRCGIPAAITLGQGIYETEAGCSELATKANNHFGIKCKKEWKGETFAHTDDRPNECFRKYGCSADSYRDHSDYLKGSPRYAALFKLSPTDYAGWAIGLKRCGYATNPRYAQNLIKIIEDFKLQAFTYAAINTMSDYKPEPAIANPVAAAGKNESADDDQVKESPIKIDTDNIIAYEPVGEKPGVPPKTVVTVEKPAARVLNGKLLNINGLKAVYAYRGDMLLQYAVKYNLRYEHLLEINDLPDAPLACDMYIYLEKKKLKGSHNLHIVKDGETMIQIAQTEGMQLKKLRDLNSLAVGEEPEEGTVLQLQQQTTRKPKVVAAATANPLPNTAPPPMSKYVATDNKNTQAATDPGPAMEAPASAPPPVAPAAAPAAPVVNKAEEKKEEKKEAPKPVINKPEEDDAPKDELARLKAQLDKAVYADDKKAPEETPAATPAPKANPAPAPKAEPKPVAKGEAKYYIVKKGDTAFSIAKGNNITVRQLMELNDLSFDEAIKVGEKLKVK